MTTHASLLPAPAELPEIRLTAEITFRAARLHEGCGPARRVLAAMLAGQIKGPILWAQRSQERDQLCPHGLAEVCTPWEIIQVRAGSEIDLLWTMEEALRSGAVGLVIGEMSAPPALTPVRRLHLAAGEARNHPLGLLLTPGEGGAAGVESRWHFAATKDGGWRARRLRARLAPEAEFQLNRGPDGLQATRL